MRGLIHQYLTCNVCRKTFSRPDMLQKHAKVHDKSAGGASGTSQVSEGDTKSNTPEITSSLSLPGPSAILVEPPNLPTLSSDDQLFGDGLSWGELECGEN